MDRGGLGRMGEQSVYYLGTFELSTALTGAWAIIAGIFSVGFILGAVFGAFVALSVWM